jgi:hypothetical protein
METRSWKFPDSEIRTRMPPGPWDDEPDKCQWEDPLTKLPCLIVRGPSGSLCGYVGVSYGHPFYNVEYSQGCAKCKDRPEVEGEYHYCEHSPESVIEVHGGLTYSGLCNPLEGDKGICHVVGPGEDDKVWWFGFDTAHAGDLCPAHIRIHEMVREKMKEELSAFDKYLRNDVYRDIGYVMAEVAGLARQLKAIKK